MWGCNFAPRGWAFCDGQLLAISQNTALFSLLGTNYGGDGRVTFGLPYLDGTAPMLWGQAQSGSQFYPGQDGGSQYVTLLESEVPPHQHSLQAEPRPAGLDTPSPANSLGRSSPAIYKSAGTSPPPLQPLAPGAIAPGGGSLPHNNMMPYLTVNFCIAMQGIYPPRP
jgi:microcystin-dependent protein